MCTLLLLGCCSFFIAPLVVSKFYFLTETVKLDRERHLDNELERSEKKIIELEREIGELRVQLALKETVAKGDAEGGKTGIWHLFKNLRLVQTDYKIYRLREIEPMFCFQTRT